MSSSVRRIVGLVLLLVLTTVGATSSLTAASSIPAFPGADGYGSRTPGGRGGRIIYVTNLNDSGDGSLRAALEAEGPRIVLFAVGGTITLQDDIKIVHPYLTIAGQTAPGDGVQIKGAMLVVRTHDVVIRYLRVRPGDEANRSLPQERDAITLAGGGAEVKRVVIDHCSLTWGPDIGGLSMLVDVHHVTIQNTIMGEGLYLSRHPEGRLAQDGHSMGASIFQLDPEKYGPFYPRKITMHHNLFTSSNIRMPMIIGAEWVDLINNVIYNWGKKAASGNPRKLNLINNIFIRGPQTEKLEAWSPHLHSTTPDFFPESVFEQGTVTEGFTTIRGTPELVYAPTRFESRLISNEQTAEEAYQSVLENVGATLPARDSGDTRIIDNLVARAGKFLNADEIIWPELQGGVAPLDSDQDGMPDSWELTFFGHALDGGTSDGDHDADGYTNVEEYLNGTDPTVR
jgi:pectate lyase